VHKAAGDTGCIEFFALEYRRVGAEWAYDIFVSRAVETVVKYLIGVMFPAILFKAKYS
jgi:hypothetical protein